MSGTRDTAALKRDLQRHTKLLCNENIDFLATPPLLAGQFRNPQRRLDVSIKKKKKRKKKRRTRPLRIYYASTFVKLQFSSAATSVRSRRDNKSTLDKSFFILPSPFSCPLRCMRRYRDDKFTGLDSVSFNERRLLTASFFECGRKFAFANGDSIGRIN